MSLSKIRVAKYEHSATSKWVVEGLKNNKGKRSRKFFRSRAEADDFARNVLQEQRQYGQKSQHLPHELRLSAIKCAEKLSVYGKSLEEATEALLERLRVSQRSCSLNKLVSEYLEIKQGKGLSRRHLQDLKNRLGKFASFAGEKTASEIKPKQIEQWLQQFGGENYNNYLQRLHGLFNYGIKREYLAENPTKVIDKVKVAETEPAIFATEEIKALLNAVARRAVPYFAIGSFAGLRPREIERLDWTDIHLEEGYIRVRPKVAKTASNRLVDIQPNLRAWLLPLSCESGPVTPPNLRKIREATQHKIGLTQWPQDGLRHSYASYHLAHFQNINELATQMGHTDTKLIFRHYRSVVTKDEAAKFWELEPSRLA
mgnify:CR=1 FL=1